MTNPEKDHNLKVKLLQKEKYDATKERVAIKDQLSKLKAECDTAMKRLQRERTDVITTNKKQVQQRTELKDVIQRTKTYKEWTSNDYSSTEK